VTALAFVDAEELLREWLATTYTPLRAGVETPANLATLAGFLQVRRIGGPVVGIRTEQATIDVDSFAPTMAVAKTNALTVQWGVERQAPGAQVTLTDGSKGVIVATACTVGPSWLPYTDTNVFRYGATYAVTVQTVH
jgi:hypothetical protein